MNYAIIVSGIVDNIIVGLPEGMYGICVDGLNVAMGDRYENGMFIKANPPEELNIKDQIATAEAQLAALKPNYDP